MLSLEAQLSPLEDALIACGQRSPEWRDRVEAGETRSTSARPPFAVPAQSARWVRCWPCFRMGPYAGALGRSPPHAIAPTQSRIRSPPTPPAPAAGPRRTRPTPRISPFRQVPVIDDDGFVVAESAAVVLYLAEKAGKLIPADVQGRTRVVQWCFAAVGTVEPTLTCLDLIGIFDSGKAAHRLHEETPKLARRWLGDVERRLQDREWISCADFTAADIMMAGVLRSIRKTDLMAPFPRLQAYYGRCTARPAWQRTLRLYAERLRVSADDIR